MHKRVTVVILSVDLSINLCVDTGGNIPVHGELHPQHSSTQLDTNISNGILFLS